MITGLWLPGDRYEVVDTEKGRKETVYIGATEEELEDPVWTDEIAHRCREWVREDWKKKDAKQKPNGAKTRQARADLAGVLRDIKASRRHYRESQHGRWW